MQSTAKTPDEYFNALPDERREAMMKLRREIKKHLPKGFQERMAYGMVAYVVPHALYPPGYHCDPRLPLSFMMLASQKNFIAIYHMGIYSDPKLMAWFIEEYPKHVPGKLDMGKSCLRFKKPENIPFKFIGELASKVTVDEWVATYESILKKGKQKK